MSKSKMSAQYETETSKTFDVRILDENRKITVLS